MQRYSLVSLDEYKAYRNKSVTTQDELVVDFLCRATRIWEQLTKRSFFPQRQTHYFDHPRVDDTKLKLDEPLLEIETFYTQNGNELVTSDEYFLLCGENYQKYPKDRIEMKSDGGRPNLLFTGTPQQANVITGIWGHHEDWSRAWADSDDDLADAVNSTTITFSVDDADGSAVDLVSPRFQELQLIKVDDEYCYVRDVNTTNNELTVERAVFGTTAAAHDAAATIYLFRPMPDVQQWIVRLTDFMMGQKDNKDTASDRPIVAGPGFMLTPIGLPRDVREAATGYAWEF